MFKVTIEPVNCTSGIEVSLTDDDRQHVSLWVEDGATRDTVNATLTPAEALRLADALRMVAGMAVDVDA